MLRLRIYGVHHADVSIRPCPSEDSALKPIERVGRVGGPSSPKFAGEAEMEFCRWRAGQKKKSCSVLSILGIVARSEDDV